MHRQFQMNVVVMGEGYTVTVWRRTTEGRQSQRREWGTVWVPRKRGPAEPFPDLLRRIASILETPLADRPERSEGGASAPPGGPRGDSPNGL